MTKHTPGPWFIEELGDGYANVLADNDICIADGLTMACARLIAAAPDLLEACEHAIKVSGGTKEQGDSFWKAIEAAIAKATS